MNPEEFAAALKEKGIELTAYQLEQFATYFQTLTEWNEKINLTALTAEEDVYLKHFYDSISAAFHFDFIGPLHICDIGAGAGFPSIPLKICFPELKVTIVDSLQKRIGFLNHLAAQLGLSDVAFYHDRAETFGKNNNFRESFDIVTARAVARMSVLSELCLPLVKKGGVFIAMKGAQVKEELSTSKAAVELLGGKTADTFSFTLPKEDSERSIVVIDKVRKTPKKYPRKPGTPNKEPIE
ncbi:16S rRNA (guanine(527)-N(7))-methyltransferase RsmG [Oceanobacillus sp. M65]|uniref:Ribosomal RNA small subunit methyltransferase G n=1 Tax=Oceanobacillus jordanicus TaxID=2867266 RepID=A0AAW5BA73_9BACI|nr:16S rRNA (guanine(527)-N(7))-methyltransferase RsmG [Oceanobacillus jordanicus]AVR01016.1 16S rRNA (guanine(527)-N(7))-methyltransferase RsmG [Oceanobacillus iheyensis]MCG3420808.1 16S rRNA (guanine(527)-N(7))-methyltransferase RsmG [Oceanobacillus jordanicus]